MFCIATFSRRRALLLLPLVLASGCSSLSDVADSLGQHMPVIGERCEHWQCFTSGGQEQSDMNKRMQAVQDQRAAVAAAPAAPDNGRKPFPQNPSVPGAQPAAARGPAPAMAAAKPAAPPNPEMDPYDYYNGTGDLPGPIHKDEE